MMPYQHLMAAAQKGVTGARKSYSRACTFGTSHEGYPHCLLCHLKASVILSAPSSDRHSFFWEGRNYIATFTDEEAKDLRGQEPQILPW